MKIAIASGKGGTGKTTVSVSLYRFLSETYKGKVQLIDCDVEEPNDLLFFKNLEEENKTEVFSLVPEIDTTKCTFCRQCAEWCEFNAITVVKKLNFAEVNTNLCHSCGACLAACNFDAIKERKKPLGVISKYKSGYGMPLVEGRLEISSAMQTALIKEVKKYISNEAAITLLDAPPGTSCPVVETVSDTDYIILVTEPTPFGLHDLKITADLVEELNIPFGLIINKAGLGNQDIYRYIKERNIELLGEIPFSKDYATNYSHGKLLENIPAEVSGVYKQIIEKLNPVITAQ